VGARDGEGALISSARAIADGGKCAWVYDVWVRPDWRRRGLARAVMRLLLEHPAVRGCRLLRLGTRDAQALYAGFGFVPVGQLPPRPYSTTEMVLLRP
jgi:ribosomal protein S18 acetylase RimI-like enzyme